MPIKVEVDGQEIETFTAEELQAQKDASVEEYKSKNPDKTADITKLQLDLESKDKELKGLKDKDFNFSNLRKEKDDLEKKLNDAIGGIDTKIENAKKEVLEGVMKDHYTETLEMLTQGDKDLAAKVELKYKNDLGSVVAGNKEEIAKKLKDAFMLTAGISPGIDSGAFGSGAVGPIQQQVNQKFNNDELDLLNKLGEAGGMKIDINKYK